ncbi:MAG TPA: class II aldolase/adducin family protein [Streptosporangiaceae bacterium]|nr:class II aldolase/adducin family protein [Streptosporangiaceae bacterium]
MSTQGSSIGAEMVVAAHALSRLGLVTAFGHVSARVPGGILITPAADLRDVTVADLIPITFTRADQPGAGRVPVAPARAAADPALARGHHGARGQEEALGLPPELPKGAPAEAWGHLQIYAVRPDVTAIARAQPPSAFAVASLVSELPILHGQAAWLGPAVPVHADARLLRSAELARAAARTLTEAGAEAHALLLRGNGALTCGPTPGEAVARMWLLATACSVWLAASASGQPRPLDAAERSYWRGVQRELLPRLWQHLRSG